MCNARFAFGVLFNRATLVLIIAARAAAQAAVEDRLREAHGGHIGQEHGFFLLRGSVSSRNAQQRSLRQANK